ncbi:unnamed protein product [Adineta ricciae]|uniref:Uncharacterized protein n=1 Tax=Adineta ricciae TaxID=249248 RepID=A0A816BKD3_ADIRI|nr:unnamed protein product [Adineta ricciae]CAF1611936.1 unnamed protein product [Adineta ricciae]
MSSLLFTEDPFDVFNYDVEDDELETLIERLSFKLKNGKRMLKPGVLAGFHSLRNALKIKVKEKPTRCKKTKSQPQQLSVPDFSFTSSFITAQQLPAPTTAQQASAATKSFSSNEHKEHVCKLIQKRCSENFDFTVCISLDENANAKASIKCKCGRLISLAKNDDKIQISNYYKYLQANGCNHMKTFKKLAKAFEYSPQSTALLTPPADVPV